MVIGEPWGLPTVGGREPGWAVFDGMLTPAWDFVAGIEDAPIPTSPAQYPNFPKPFNPMTTIRYDLVVGARVRLSVFDLLGREIVRLVDELQAIGSYEVVFDATTVTSGIYAYSLRAGDYRQSRRMVRRSRLVLPIHKSFLSLLMNGVTNMTRMLTTLVICAMFLPKILFAQVSPYAELDDRPIKALSPEQIDQYRSGAGLGFALAAELNGFPGPKHVLELIEKLELTPEQAEKIRKIFDTMHADAVRLGVQFVEQEHQLDSLFASRSVTPESMKNLLVSIGQTWGELRGVHLGAHLETADILSEHQTRRYAMLRGYDAATEHEGGDKHH